MTFLDKISVFVLFLLLCMCALGLGNYYLLNNELNIIFIKAIVFFMALALIHVIINITRMMDINQRHEHLLGFNLFLLVDFEIATLTLYLITSVSWLSSMFVGFIFYGFSHYFFVKNQKIKEANKPTKSR